VTIKFCASVGKETLTEVPHQGLLSMIASS
jgi:hypothetical protein